MWQPLKCDWWCSFSNFNVCMNPAGNLLKVQISAQEVWGLGSGCCLLTSYSCSRPSDHTGSSKAADSQSWGMTWWPITGYAGSSWGTSPEGSYLPPFSSTMPFFHVCSSIIASLLSILGSFSPFYFTWTTNFPSCLPSLPHHCQSIANHNSLLKKKKSTGFPIWCKFLWPLGLSTI